MSMLAAIRGLSVTYRRDGSEVAAVRGISLDVVAGERLAIIGESGSGKSTLALAIAGLLPASARVEGSIAWSWPSSDAQAPPSVLPDISPARGEVALTYPLSPVNNAAEDRPTAKLPISPLAGEMSGRTERGVTELDVNNPRPGQTP